MWTRAQVPFLRILIPFMVGIILAYYFPALSTITITLGGIGILAVAIGIMMKKNGHLFLYISFLCIGAAIMGMKNDKSGLSEIETHEKIRIAVVKDRSIELGKGVQLKVRLLIGDILVKVFTLWKHSSSVRIGDTIIFKSRLDFPLTSSTEWGFDYRKYLASKNIYYTTYIGKGRLLEHRPFTGFSLLRQAQILEEHIIGIIKTHLPEGVGIALIQSVVFGDKSMLEDGMMQEMKYAGLLDIMAVSGFHIGVMFLFFTWLFYPLKRWKYMKGILVIAGIWLFILLCGMPASAVRAGIMLSLYEVGKIIDAKSNKFNILFVSCFLILLIEPFQILQIGFQFSYVALSGIFLFYPKINEKVIEFTDIPSFIGSPISVSLAAQGILAPLCFYYFGFVSYWFLLWGLVAIPLTMLILMGSFAVLLTSFIPIIADALAYLPYLGSKGLTYISHVQYYIPIDGMYIHFPLFMMLGTFLLIIGIALQLHYKLALKKYIFYFSLLLGIVFAIYRGNVLKSQSIYAFSSFGKNYILLKNGTHGIVIGDSLSVMGKDLIRSYLGIKTWQFKRRELNDSQLALSITHDGKTEPLAFYKADVLLKPPFLKKVDQCYEHIKPADFKKVHFLDL